MLPGEEDSIDLAQFRLIPDALMIVEAAVGLSKTLGSEVRHTKRRDGFTYGLTCLTENIDPKRS